MANRQILTIYTLYGRLAVVPMCAYRFKTIEDDVIRKGGTIGSKHADGGELKIP
jgi:hypothetical protein